jgi:hypothetical protein
MNGSEGASKKKEKKDVSKKKGLWGRGGGGRNVNVVGWEEER